MSYDIIVRLFLCDMSNYGLSNSIYSKKKYSPFWDTLFSHWLMLHDDALMSLEYAQNMLK